MIWAATRQVFGAGSDELLSFCYRFFILTRSDAPKQYVVQPQPAEWHASLKARSQIFEPLFETGVFVFLGRQVRVDVDPSSAFIQ